MAAPPQAAEQFYRLVQSYQLGLLTVGRRLWRRVLPGDLDGSWARVAPQLVAYTSGAQLAAATAGAAYVPAVLDEIGVDAEAEARVRPEVFAGVAFDGRPLDSLLEGGIRAAKHYIGRGVDGGDAAAHGLRWLETALRTVVTDAARDATAVGMAVRPAVTAWVRVVNPPCCSRCAVLAGVIYEWNKPMPRHPRCDCFTLPTTVAAGEAYRTDPTALAKRGLITDLTPDQRKRIDSGANLTRVLNESRDAWRVRMAVERKAAKEAAKRAATWGTNAPTPLPPGGIQDFLSHLTSRVDALRELEARGVVTT